MLIQLKKELLLIKYLDKYNLNYNKINEEFINKRYDIKNKKYLLKDYINKYFKNSSENSQIAISVFNSNNKELPYIITKNNSEKIYYYDNCFILNEIIMKLLNIDLNNYPRFNYYIKKQNIFIFQSLNSKTIIEVGKFDSQNTYKVDFLIETIKGYKQIINLIQNKTFIQFFTSHFILKFGGIKGYSPFFDGQNKVIGNAYFLKKGNNNFSNDYYNPNFMNIIFLIIYFKNLNSNNSNLNSEKYFYLISEIWLNSYKRKYMYEYTKREISKNYNEIFSNIINIEQKIKNILKKLIYVLISSMPELNKKLNNINNFSDDCPSEPELEFIKDYFNGGKMLSFYKNFFILNEEIYNKIFNLNEQQSLEMKMKNNYCKCSFKEGYIFIFLNNYIKQSKNIVIEVGKFDIEQKFILIYLLIYDSNGSYNYNLEIMKSLGFKSYFTSLPFDKEDVITLKGDKSEIGGYIFKYAKEIIDI